jgi:hypothetical protein
MGTKKNGHFGKKIRAPGGSYTRRERGFAAQAPLTGPPPACRSVPPAAPSRLPLRPRTRPPGKSIPRLIKSSTHFRPPLLTIAQEIPKLAVHKFGFRGTRQLLPYLRSHSTSTKINFAAIIIASRTLEVEVPGSSSRLPEHSGDRAARLDPG